MFNSWAPCCPLHAVEPGRAALTLRVRRRNPTVPQRVRRVRRPTSAVDIRVRRHYDRHVGRPGDYEAEAVRGWTETVAEVEDRRHRAQSGGGRAAGEGGYPARSAGEIPNNHGRKGGVPLREGGRLRLGCGSLEVDGCQRRAVFKGGLTNPGDARAGPHADQPDAPLECPGLRCW